MLLFWKVWMHQPNTVNEGNSCLGQSMQHSRGYLDVHAPRPEFHLTGTVWVSLVHANSTGLWASQQHERSDCIICMIGPAVSPVFDLTGRIGWSGSSVITMVWTLNSTSSTFGDYHLKNNNEWKKTVSWPRGSVTELVQIRSRSYYWRTLVNPSPMLV